MRDKRQAPRRKPKSSLALGIRLKFSAAMPITPVCRFNMAREEGSAAQRRLSFFLNNAHSAPAKQPPGPLFSPSRKLLLCDGLNKVAPQSESNIDETSGGLRESLFMIVLVRSCP
jgi:hypothetical protein